MTGERPVPASTTEARIQVSNSTFIASASPASTPEEARAFIDQIKQQHPDAAHHVPIFIIGHPPATIEHSSDDGEPSGTAGRPALAVLRGSGLGDIAVVITRYFGGTKLGTGGLVRAYSDAIRELLGVMPVAYKTATITTEFTIPYALYEQTQLLIENNRGILLEQNFEVEVTVRCKFRRDEFAGFKSQLIELSSGQIHAPVVSENPDDFFEAA
jgi:uncharacterized YigZ family protein